MVGLAGLFAKCQAASFFQMTFKFEAQGEMRITYEEPFSSFLFNSSMQSKHLPLYLLKLWSQIVDNSSKTISREQGSTYIEVS